MKGMSWPAWRRVSGQLGMPGCLGLCIALGACLAWWGWLPEAQAQWDDQKAQLSLLRLRLQAGTHATGAGVSSTSPAGRPAQVLVEGQQTWQALWQTLPTQAGGADLQVEILALARAQGVQAQSVQYKGAAFKGLPSVWRQQISLPVEAPYPALRAWLAQMQGRPAISIDALEIGRADPMSDQVKARVALSVWWRVLDAPEARP